MATTSVTLLAEVSTARRDREKVPTAVRMVAIVPSPLAVSVHLTIFVVNTVLIVAVIVAIAPAEAIELVVVERVAEALLAVSSRVAIAIKGTAVSATAVTLHSGISTS